MGLMLGEFVDEYTVRVIDVFAMPQSGTGVSVEAVDPVFQVREAPDYGTYSQVSKFPRLTKFVSTILPPRLKCWTC